ncbi:MAG: 4Fe-4S binding protein [Methanomassiliicoccus sp.]|nr:4Fe-4S binding protein [Methanomassiliicoccus sp.]
MPYDPRYENPVSALGLRALRRTRDVAARHARVPSLRALVRRERCVGCGACVRKGFCRFGAISMDEDKKAVVDDSKCRGCTRCTHLCPRNAFTLEVQTPAIMRETLRTLDKEFTRFLDQEKK